jgi:NADH-quinone oxidoreductase subunit L
MEHNLHLWLIPLLPLAGALINGALGRRFAKPLVTTIALASTAAAFGMALYVVSQFSGLQLPYVESHGPWIAINGFNVDFAFMLDQLSLIMLLVVTGVGFLIHIYSAGYMADDDGYYRFFSYLNLFMFFMLMLVLANNYLLMFVGWEGVGLASYLLIGFYFHKHSAAQAGKKAFIVNRVGDFGFLLGMFLLVKHFGSLDYSVIFNQILQHPAQFPIESGAGLLTLVSFCLMVGATGKSAQIPLYVWLPDAMEGPTPVSALIHAATMVTAGIYMVARSNVIFNHAPMALNVVAIIGALTAFFAASIGIVQTDIKRVLAYSTISQLGYMFMACGVAAYSAGIFHLMTHAFFKALLFLSAGSVIHALGGEQDMRYMGGLRKHIPVTFWVMTIATIAIAGIPPFAGFFSKDEILWKAFSSSDHGWIFWAIGLVTALMTSFYMFRLLFMTFFGERREGTSLEPGHGHGGHGAHEDHGHGHAPHESPWIMLGPLVVLAVLSVVGGWVGIPHSMGKLIGVQQNHFEEFLAPVFEHGNSEQVAASESKEPPTKYAKGEAASDTHPSDATEIELTGVSILAGLIGLFAAWYLYLSRPELPGRIVTRIGGLYSLVVHKYYVDEIYQDGIVEPIVDGSRSVLWKGVDVEVIDGAVNGAGSTAKGGWSIMREMQSGNIRSYAGWVALGAACLVAYMIWMGAQ